MKEIHKKTEHEKSSMKINGWVEEIRDLGGIKFIDLHTPQGNHQITLVKGKVSDELLKLVDRKGELSSSWWKRNNTRENRDCRVIGDTTTF